MCLTHPISDWCLSYLDSSPVLPSSSTPHQVLPVPPAYLSVFHYIDHNNTSSHSVQISHNITQQNKGTNFRKSHFPVRRPRSEWSLLRPQPEDKQDVSIAEGVCWTWPQNQCNGRKNQLTQNCHKPVIRIIAIILLISKKLWIEK